MPFYRRRKRGSDGLSPRQHNWLGAKPFTHSFRCRYPLHTYLLVAYCVPGATSDFPGSKPLSYFIFPPEVSDLRAPRLVLPRPRLPSAPLSFPLLSSPFPALVNIVNNAWGILGPWPRRPRAWEKSPARPAEPTSSPPPRSGLRVSVILAACKLGPHAWGCESGFHEG